MYSKTIHIMSYVPPFRDVEINEQLNKEIVLILSAIKWIKTYETIAIKKYDVEI